MVRGSVSVDRLVNDHTAPTFKNLKLFFEIEKSTWTLLSPPLLHLGQYAFIYNSSVHKSVLTEQYIEHIS